MTQPTDSMDDIVVTVPSHMTTIETSHYNHDDSEMTATDSTTEDSHHVTTTGTSHDNHVTMAETSRDDHMTSPEQSARAEGEAEEVYLAREELVALQMNRRRVEARHGRLGRKLMEIQTKKSQLQEVYTYP